MFVRSNLKCSPDLSEMFARSNLNCSPDLSEFTVNGNIPLTNITAAQNEVALVITKCAGNILW